MDLVSLTVLKAKGKDLPFEFPSTYGSVILPYFETFQDTIGGEEICVNVSELFSFTYKSCICIYPAIMHLNPLNLFFFFTIKIKEKDILVNLKYYFQRF